MNAKLFSFLFLFLIVCTSANAQWVTNGTTVYTNGKVGIGRSNPTVELRVAGTTETDKLTLNNTMGRHMGVSTYEFTYNGTIVPSYSFSWSDKDIYASGGYTLWVSSDFGMKFFTGKTPRLTINPDGNIGIGTTSPYYKLDVIGTIRAQEIRVNTDGADFVFEDDYELPSLDEVANHIREKKHLPGIASAKAMQENGVGLAELNTKLLQKIEELTLYVIEQNQTIKEQGEAIEKLRKELKN